MILTALMAHQRTLIREAFIALLSGATAAGARVLDSQVSPWKKTGLPAISVFTLSEPAEGNAANSPSELTRSLQVELVGFVRGLDEKQVARAMDDLAKEIEDRVITDPTVGGNASDSVLADTNMEIRAENGASDPLIGIIALTFEVTYRTDLVAADPVDDFRSVDAKHRIVGAVEANQARDVFVVQETPP